MSDLPDRIHKKLIETIVKGLSTKPLVLKGGTALMLAYDLDRYSEDIDYDSNTKIDLVAEVGTIMRENTRMQYSIKSKKITDTTSRIFVNYTTENIEEETLKIEVKNNLALQLEDIQNDRGFNVYSINWICQNKIDITRSRIKPRDFYDLGHISRQFKSELNEKNLRKLTHIAEDKTLHDLYRTQWHKDKFVREKSFEATIRALKSIKTYLQNKEKESEYDYDR